MAKGMSLNAIIATVLVVALFGVFATLFSTNSIAQITGAAGQEGFVNINVPSAIGVEVDAVYDTVSFGVLALGVSDDTTDNVPLPILIRNEGSVLADVQIEANDLWTSPSRLASDYRFSISVPNPAALTLTESGLAADTCVPTPCFDPLGSITVATNMPITPLLPANAIDDLEFTDANDEAEMDIYITVPSDEPFGAKSSTVTVTGVDASTF